MLKIALVNPPQSSRYSQPPMGLATLAAVLEKQGYAVNVVDANALKLSPEAIAAPVGEAEVVGLTAVTPTINTAIAIARSLKKAKPNVTVVLGGAHATLLPEETLAGAPEIDIAVRGEGEQTIIDLLQVLEGRQPPDKVAGVSYRRDGRVVSNPPRSGFTDLDALPFLAYHLLPWRSYRPHPPHGRALPFAAIITSRGCPYRCSYCSKPIFSTKFRAQGPARVVGEIVYLQQKFGIKELAVYDDVFTLDRKRAMAIAEGMLQKGIRLDWSCETRVNLVDKELLQAMRRAGCYSVAYGIESGSPEILKTLHKDISLEQVEAAVRLTREAGLQAIGYFMIGSPGESRETIIKTVEFAKKLRLDFAQFAITTPFPGTELYDLYLKDKAAAVPWDNFVYGSTGHKLVPVFESDKLSRADLQYWAKRAYRDFYLRPAYFWQRLKRLSDLKVNIKGFFMLLANMRGGSA